LRAYASRAQVEILPQIAFLDAIRVTGSIFSADEKEDEKAPKCQIIKAHEEQAMRCVQMKRVPDLRYFDGLGLPWGSI
jgi:hypothetical protein